jgi:hypothetical protein
MSHWGKEHVGQTERDGFSVLNQAALEFIAIG